MTIQQLFLSSLLSLLALISLLSGSPKDMDCIYSPLVKNVVIVNAGIASKYDCLPIDHDSKSMPNLQSQLKDAESFFEMIHWEPLPINIEILEQNTMVQKGLIRIRRTQFETENVFLHSLVKSVILQNLDESIMLHPLQLEVITDFLQHMALRNHVKAFEGPSVGLWSTTTICDSPWNPLEYEFSCTKGKIESDQALSLWGLRPYLLRSFQDVHSSISIAERIQFTRNFISRLVQRKWTAQKEFQVETVASFESRIKGMWNEIVGDSVLVKSDFRPYQKMDGVIYTDSSIEKNQNVIKNKKFAWYDQGAWYLPSEKSWIKVKWGSQKPLFQQLHVFSCKEPKIGELLKIESKKREIIYLLVCEKNFVTIGEVVGKNPFLIARENPKRRMIVYDRPSLELSLNWGFREDDQIVKRLEQKRLTDKQLRLTGLRDLEEPLAPESDSLFYHKEIEKISAALPVVQYLRL